jgi:hypothetical protein
MNIDIAAFRADTMVNAPGGATHFRLRAGGAAIDFESDNFSADMAETAELPLTGVQAPLQLNLRVSPSINPMFLIFGIEFLQIVNGSRYPLKSEAHNAMAIVRVDGHSSHNIKTSNISAVKRLLPKFGGKEFKDRPPRRLKRKPVNEAEETGCAFCANRINTSGQITPIMMRAG